MWMVVLCLYAGSACSVLLLNMVGERFGVPEVVEAVLVAVTWPLVLLPWRQWLNLSPPGRHEASLA